MPRPFSQVTVSTRAMTSDFASSNAKLGRPVITLAALSTTQIIIIIAVAAVVVLAIVGIALTIRKRRTQKLRTRFGSAEIVDLDPVLSDSKTVANLHGIASWYV